MTLALNKELAKRAVVLLRASSKQQTDREHDFDIPQQKSILLPFVESKGWDLVKVFTEGGVSGFKVSANDRDAIQDIKKMADRREFDILVIYMSDRLGRIADETPLIVSYLNQRGITVFSYTEGEISAKDHTSKLITYIRYWQAEGESRKTSQRVSDAIVQAVTEGRYRGGATAYGYKMINNGRNNYKGKPVLDITVDEDGEAPVVRLIYFLARERNMGCWANETFIFDDGILYNKEKTILVACLEYKAGDFTIPKSVTEIYDCAFEGCINLTSIVIPDTIEKMGKRAFLYCKNLQSINIPESISAISDAAFVECYSLKGIEIPESVTSIGSRAFEHCEAMVSISLPSGITKIEAETFSDCKKLKEVIIPNGVTSIGDEAFYTCISLESITLPNTVASIGYNAFGFCKKLEKVVIPNSTTDLGMKVFASCDSLMDVTIPESVVNIGDNAFYGCLKDLTITGNTGSLAEEYAKNNGIKFQPM